jgi:poly-gamma-glutamate system protein
MPPVPGWIDDERYGQFHLEVGVAQRIMSRNTRMVIAGLLSLLAFGAMQALPSSSLPANADVMVRAGQIMERAILAIRKSKEPAGFDLRIDPNRTGLIGPESSPLRTSLGDLEAKRSTTNPNIAGYMVHLLQQAGAKPGGNIAVGSSGSFPALLVAALAAAKALNVRAATILSLGASSYGATDPDFTLLDLYELLRREGICRQPPAALSLGGDKDIGNDFDAEIKDRLMTRIQASGLPFIYEPDLAKNVARRMEIYDKASPGSIAAFINCGGSYANMGTSSRVLEVRPGLHHALAVPSVSSQGVLFGMAARGIPIIHLLFIKGLVMEAGLPWDPIPLPRPAVIHTPGSGAGSRFWLISIGYFTSLILLAAWRKR